MRLLREPPSPHPTPPNSLHWISVLVLFSLLWSIQKTNNQKHKAIIIKLSAGTTPSPHTHVKEVGWGLKQEGEEKPLTTHQRGQPRALLGSARAVVWVGWGVQGSASQSSPRDGPKPTRERSRQGPGTWGSLSTSLPLPLDSP